MGMAGVSLRILLRMALLDLTERIVGCERCPRLRAWCTEVAETKRAAFRNEVYWGRPVPPFGDPDARGLIVGLAPAAHGANRTGRLFTGDRSGDWLFRALFRAGLANQPLAISADDGLELRNVLIMPVVACAPPANKPLPEEILNCRPYLAEMLASREWKAILCLGGIAWQNLFATLGTRPPTPFGHGAEAQVGATTYLASYHPSQQNTFTGKLTEAMLDDVVGRFSLLIR